MSNDKLEELIREVAEELYRSAKETAHILGALMWVLYKKGYMTEDEFDQAKAEVTLEMDSTLFKKFLDKLPPQQKASQ